MADIAMEATRPELEEALVSGEDREKLQADRLARAGSALMRLSEVHGTEYELPKGNDQPRDSRFLGALHSGWLTNGSFPVRLQT